MSHSAKIALMVLIGRAHCGLRLGQLSSWCLEFQGSRVMGQTWLFVMSWLGMQQLAAFRQHPIKTSGCTWKISNPGMLAASRPQAHHPWTHVCVGRHAGWPCRVLFIMHG